MCPHNPLQPRNIHQQRSPSFWRASLLDFLNGTLVHWYVTAWGCLFSWIQLYGLWYSLQVFFCKGRTNSQPHQTNIQFFEVTICYLKLLSSLKVLKLLSIPISVDDHISDLHIPRREAIVFDTINSCLIPHIFLDWYRLTLANGVLVFHTQSSTSNTWQLIWLSVAMPPNLLIVSITAWDCVIFYIINLYISNRQVLS